MLCSLSIRNYVLIDSLDIEFPAGLVIITGQTGAGKSIILGALSLALGSKADLSAIGPAGDSCVVEAEFSVKDESGRMAALLEENGIESGISPETGEGSLIIRRVLSRNGRSRTFVNDCPAPVKLLSELSSGLIDIHSQHETMMLRDKQFQMSMLDHYAGDKDKLNACRAAWKTLSGLKRGLEEMKARLAGLSAERDYNQALLDQLVSASLSEGEIEELEAEQKMLANAEEIKTSLCQIENLMGGDESETMSIDTRLKETCRTLDKLSAYIPELKDLSARVESSRLELDDILGDIEAREESTEVSEERLAQVEDRLSLLYGLLKKHNCLTITDLIALRDELDSSLSDTGGLEERIAAAGKKIAEAQEVYDNAAQALSDARRAAVAGFSDSVCSLIRSLDLERSVFEAVLSDAAPGPEGKDSILFVFSSTGTSPVDVAKCASGGELSRIMLSLKAMMARYTNMPAMIFDEIDTGVSGSAADKMGSMICSMGAYMQVFAITHLPQVAAKGDAHYIVTKTFSGDRAGTDIRRISGRERVNEIARMLSGSEITPEAVANAEALLSR